MYARVNRFLDDPARIAENERYAEAEVLPELKSIPGFQGILALVDRATGDSLAITFWETEQDMRASEGAADRIREEASEVTQSQVRTVDRYEVSMRVGV